jgi:subtilisin family serine protease
MKQGGKAGVVLMAFGRPKKQGEANPEDLIKAIKELDEKGVQIVASAGNDDSAVEEIPACLAVDPNLPVFSVGAGTSEQNREPYSNHGPWVRQWRPGTVVSLMPLTGADDPHGHGNGYALWSGTSFSAAIVAGELAHARAAERAASAGS